MRKLKTLRGSSEQALVETALMLPVFLFIVVNAVNFAYFFLMAVNITGASRNSGSTLYRKCKPSFNSYTDSRSTNYSLPGYHCDDTVSDLALQDLCGAVFSLD